MATPDPVKVKERAAAIRKVLWWILLANWVVAAAKLVTGLMGDSASLTADGLHSFIDGASNVIGLVAMAVASRPADDGHPYGHGKFEGIASLSIGVMVGAAAVGLGRMAYGAITGAGHPQADTTMIAVTVVTLAVNVVISTLEARLGKRLGSPLLVADSRHTLSDVLVSVAVLGSLVLVRLGFERADGFVAAGVMVMVGVVAWRIVKQAIGTLVDSACLDRRHVEAASLAVPGVLEARRVRSRGLGASVFIDLTVGVAKSSSLDAAHAIADAVEAALIERFPEVSDVVVHVEPVP